MFFIDLAKEIYSSLLISSLLLISNSLKVGIKLTILLTVCNDSVVKLLTKIIILYKINLI